MLLLKKSRSILVGLIFIFALPLMAQENPPKKDAKKKMAPKKETLPAVGIEIGNFIVSNLVFRGGDIFTIYADQTKQSYGSTTGAWSYEPYILYTTPVKGLSFVMWTNYTLQGREDVDTDGRFQTTPGGDNIFASDLKTLLAGGTPNLLSTYNTSVAGIGNANTVLSTNPGGEPKQYKEKNGMKRADEVDLEIKYSATGKPGTVFFGLHYYLFPSKLDAIKSASATEVFFGYGLPGAFSDVSATVWIRTDNSNTYAQVTYAPKIKLTKLISLNLSANVGYGIQPDIQGIQDVTGSIGLSAGGFSIAFNAAYRPTLAFFDTDTNNRYAWSWLNGGSDGYDGYVADPAQQGLEADIMKALIEQTVTNLGNANYSYTARQKLPRMLYWVSLGYTISI